MKYNLSINAEPPFVGTIYTVKAGNADKRRRRANLIVTAWIIAAVAIPFDLALYVSPLSAYVSAFVIYLLTFIFVTGRRNFFAMRLKLPSFMLHYDAKDYINEMYVDTVVLRSGSLADCSMATFVIERKKDDNAHPQKDETRKAHAIYHNVDMDTLNEIVVICSNQTDDPDMIKSLDTAVDRARRKTQ